MLLGTLKTHKLSNTQVLSEFLIEKLVAEGAECELIKLADYIINPGTDEQEGDDDRWPEVYAKLTAADIIVLATPVWWGSHSSLTQRVIERLDVVHDEIIAGKLSRLADKPGGIVITGDGDGAEHIIGVLANFYNALGMVFPPYATLSVLWDGHGKNKSLTHEELMEKYRNEYADTAATMAKQLMKYA